MIDPSRRCYRSCSRTAPTRGSSSAARRGRTARSRRSRRTTRPRSACRRHEDTAAARPARSMASWQQRDDLALQPVASVSERIDRTTTIQQRRLRRRPLHTIPSAIDGDGRSTRAHHRTGSVSEQQLGKPMTRAHQIHPDRLPRTHKISERLLLIARNTTGCNPRQQQPRQVLRVPTISLHPVPRRTRIFDGAATTHSTRRLIRSRASPYPVGPASYAARTGPGSPAQNPAAPALSPSITNVLSSPV